MEYDWNQYAPDDYAVLCFLRRQQSENGQVLLIEKKRGLGAGKVNGPGGKQEPGESLQETAVRETYEEVGLRPESPEARGILRFVFADGYELEVHIYEATVWSGTMVETDEARPFWVPEDSIPYDRMWEDDAYWLPRVLAGITVDAEMLFDGDVMVTWDIRFSDGEHLIGSKPA